MRSFPREIKCILDVKSHSRCWCLSEWSSSNISFIRLVTQLQAWRPTAQHTSLFFLVLQEWLPFNWFSYHWTAIFVFSNTTSRYVTTTISRSRRHKVPVNKSETFSCQLIKLCIVKKITLGSWHPCWERDWSTGLKEVSRSRSWVISNLSNLTHTGDNAGAIANQATWDLLWKQRRESTFDLKLRVDIPGSPKQGCHSLTKRTNALQNILKIRF